MAARDRQCACASRRFSTRTARCTSQTCAPHDALIRIQLKGGGEEIWEPKCTFHGFRYVEVTGYPGHPPLDAVTGVVIHSAAPVTGVFECSNPMVNQLVHNISLGTARQLYRSSHRLPATRRASRLDRRRASVYRNRRLQYGCSLLLHKVACRSRGFTKR